MRDFDVSAYMVGKAVKYVAIKTSSQNQIFFLNLSFLGLNRLFYKYINPI